MTDRHPREIRQALGLTQRELARALSVSRRTVQLWEARGMIDRRTRYALLYLTAHMSDSDFDGK